MDDEPEHTPTHIRLTVAMARDILATGAIDEFEETTRQRLLAALANAPFYYMVVGRHEREIGMVVEAVSPMEYDEIHERMSEIYPDPRRCGCCNSWIG